MGRMLRRVLLPLVAALALCAGVASAIFEDQAGEFDWSVENLGRVTAVAFGGAVTRGQASATRGTTRALYVASDERSRALARLDAKTGAIKWRHILHQGLSFLVIVLLDVVLAKMALVRAAGDNVDAIQLTNYGLLSVSG